MNIFIGGAWVYANGPTHIGHIAALLPGDVIARYHRLKGNRVCYVSGSDCHGTPITLRAKRENTTYEEVCENFHEEFLKDFDYLGFSYDVYGKTTSEIHKDFVEKFHRKLYESEYIYEKSAPQVYCEKCEKFLSDRFVVGICPKCGKKAKGDQCDHCGNIYQPEELSEIRCILCGGEPVFRNSKHLYIGLTKLKDELEEFSCNSKKWRKNAVSFTKRYIDEGLRDRAITRDID